MHTGTTDLLKCWHDHFQALVQSKFSSENCKALDNNLLYQAFLLNKDDILDDNLTLEEVERAINIKFPEKKEEWRY